MFRFGDILCCNQDSYEEKDQYSPFLPASIEDPLPAINYWDVFNDGKSTQESVLTEEQISIPSFTYNPTLAWTNRWDLHMDILPPTAWVPVCRHLSRQSAPLREKLSILNDWATALGSRHAKGVVHGNLTPESVDVVHRRGILLDQKSLLDRGLLCTEGPPDDDLYGVRWAATELFHIDKGNPRPTTMSDVYSFGCLMLQMLTGRVPYCGTKRLEQVVYLKYLGREPIDAQTPEVADRYVTFMRWCWSSDPEKRPTMETVVGFIHEEFKKLADRHG